MVRVATDLFVLPVHFCVAHTPCKGPYIASMNVPCTKNDIGATNTKHIEMAKFAQPLQALTCFNTVNALYGLGEERAAQAFAKGIILQSYVNWV